MINGEGGRIAEENRVEYIFDQVETTSTTWLGLTMTCSRCHDHKYDPISLDDYYGLFAVFNQTPVNGGGGNGQTPPVVEFKAKGQTAKVMVMADSKKRDTFVLQRGTYNKPGRKVSASVVRGLHEPPSGEAVSRMTLAKWIVDPENPLTARVTVNRFWQTFFGAGLVRTPEDFGVQGQKPTHPELLDWLAADFIESGWDVKRLIKQMLMSATYRQSSAAGRDAYAHDPENRLLARGARFRLPSWMIRDQALLISGLLNRERGGPSVNSYQPEGVWAEATFGKIKYKQDSGSNLYRRSLYLFWRRIVGPTTFFDVAKRQTCEVKPLRTNSPLHALVTLNDVTYVEAARVFAEKLLVEHDSDRERLGAGFRIATGRLPTDRELALLSAKLTEFRRNFEADQAAAQQLASAGQAKRKTELSHVDVAIYTTVCNLLLNLDEVITRE